jgi:hypothetical protein
MATDGNFTCFADQIEVEAIISNVGAVAAQVINLWVFDATLEQYGFNDTIATLDLNLNPGEILALTGENAIFVSIPGASYADDFNAWFVTGRGNTVAVEETQMRDIIVADVAQGIGYLGMDFDAFRYYQYASPNTLANWPNGTGSYVVDRTEAIVFRIKLTNFDPSGAERPLTLNSHSLVWVYFPAQGKQVAWYIVNVDEDGTIQPTYSPIVISYRETVFAYFASGHDGTFSGISDHVKTGTVGPAAINLLLLGTIGSSYYGQNIPFVSIYSN